MVYKVCEFAAPSHSVLPITHGAPCLAHDLPVFWIKLGQHASLPPLRTLHAEEGCAHTMQLLAQHMVPEASLTPLAHVGSLGGGPLNGHGWPAHSAILFASLASKLPVP